MNFAGSHFSPLKHIDYVSCKLGVLGKRDALGTREVEMLASSHEKGNENPDSRHAKPTRWILCLPHPPPPAPPLTWLLSIRHKNSFWLSLSFFCTGLFHASFFSMENIKHKYDKLSFEKLGCYHMGKLSSSEVQVPKPVLHFPAEICNVAHAKTGFSARGGGCSSKPQKNMSIKSNPSVRGDPACSTVGKEGWTTSFSSGCGWLCLDWPL